MANFIAKSDDFGVQVAAIVLAAGSGSRMEVPAKVFAPLCGRPVASWSLDVFENHKEIGNIILVAGEHTMEIGREMLASGEWPKVSEVVAGGETRFESVCAGLDRVPDSTEWIVLHDAARPFVDVTMVSACLEKARQCGAAVAAIPVVDTIKVAEGHRITNTIPRDHLWAAQTPQVYRRRQLLEAISRTSIDAGEITDEARLFEMLELPICVSEGSRANWKLTLPGDLERAEVLMRIQNREQMAR